MWSWSCERAGSRWPGEGVMLSGAGGARRWRTRCCMLPWQEGSRVWAWPGGGSVGVGGVRTSGSAGGGV